MNDYTTPTKEETDRLLLQIRATLSPEEQRNFDEDVAAIQERLNEYTMNHMTR